MDTIAEMDADIEVVIISAQWVMDEVQKSINPDCHTLSSELFRIH
jgi:hypothetical protein